MKKKLYFGSNFKMYKNVKDTLNYLGQFTEAVRDLDKERVQFFFIPSYTSLDRVSRCENRKEYMLGAQNMCWESEGQFTGEISPAMLEELGLDLVMIGHSERRHGFGESNITENKKVRKALEYGFTTLLCVGETLEEKEYGISEEILRTQLKTGLHGVEKKDISKIWIAYEPVWSIGVNGTPASSEYAEAMHKGIKKLLCELFGEEGKEIPVLYGGSVNSENGNELIAQPDIDGLFTTRTAFQIDKFVGIIKHAIEGMK